MNLPWFIFLAWRQLLPAGRRRGSVFFFLGMLGVALGVCVLVIVQSVMGGFGRVHRERIIDTSGHLDLSDGGYPMLDVFATVDSLERLPQVAQVTPYARGFVMAKRGNIPTFPAVYGFAYSDDPVFRIGPYLQEGSLEDLFDDTVLVSRQLANSMRLQVGSELEVYSPTLLDQLASDAVVLPRILQVAGIFHVDWNQDFIPGLFVTLRTMQDLYGLGDAVHGIAVRLQPHADEAAVAEALREQFDGQLQVLTWRERWADFLWVLDLEKTLMLFLNLFIVAVAVFAIAIAQLLTVVRKTREIGLLAVLGGSRRHVLALYCFQGFVIGLLGTVLGIAMAISALAFRDPIINALAAISGSRETLTRFYYFANLPVQYSVGEILFISAVAVALSTLASLLPAMRAAALRPADTLRVDQ